MTGIDYETLEAQQDEMFECTYDMNDKPLLLNVENYEGLCLGEAVISKITKVGIKHFIKNMI